MGPIGDPQHGSVAHLCTSQLEPAQNMSKNLLKKVKKRNSSTWVKVILQKVQKVGKNIFPLSEFQKKYKFRENLMQNELFQIDRGPF